MTSATPEHVGPEPLGPVGGAKDGNLFRLLVDRVLDYAIILLEPDGLFSSRSLNEKYGVPERSMMPSITP